MEWNGDHMDKNGEEMERKQKWRINGEQTDKNGEEMEQKAKMEREWRKCSVPWAMVLAVLI